MKASIEKAIGKAFDPEAGVIKGKHIQSIVRVSMDSPKEAKATVERVRTALGDLVKVTKGRTSKESILSIGDHVVSLKTSSQKGLSKTFHSLLVIYIRPVSL